MMHTKIVAVWSSIVQFLFQKQIQIHETILVKMRCESSKFDKNLPNWIQFLVLHFENLADQAVVVWILILNRKLKSWDNSCQNGIVEIHLKKKGWSCFLCTTFSSQYWVNKTLLSLYFWTNFNNLLTILTRIVSHFYSKSKLDHCSLIGIVLKV